PNLCIPPVLHPLRVLGGGARWSQGVREVLHSLRYLDVAVSEPSPGIPQYMAIGYLDGIPFVRYDSAGRMEPLTQWIKDGVELGYWERETQRVSDVDSQGLHTWLRLSGCDLLSDGSVRGSQRYGYDGRDFISFDLGFRKFVAADSAEAERWTNYLKHVCPEWLKKYVGYGQKELEHKEPPDVHVSGREEHGTLILSCHAYGFYPNTIAVSWMKGGETLDQETEWGGIVPNSDGTFHTWARIEALPEEREQYRCRVEHPGMPEPGIFAWEPTSGGNLTVVVAVSIIAAILILTVGWNGAGSGWDSREGLGQDGWGGMGGAGLGQSGWSGIRWHGWSRISAGLGWDQVGFWSSSCSPWTPARSIL
uniref:Uncharacterized protein n=1 Tax=Geospiza parvula TaxID=87175 RepID=A0A8U8BQK7_GEOPR